MASLLLIGCGKMGGALLKGWSAAFPAAAIVVVEPNGVEDAPDGVTILADEGGIPDGFAPDAVILAVKPQMMDRVAPVYGRYAGSAVYLSIAAGKPISYFQRHFGDDAAIVRAMPNTPAAIGRGISVAVANAQASQAQRDLCHRLLEAAGAVAWTDDEDRLDAVTALSGSGPAYVFLLAECLAKAGEEAGLPADLAMQLARATVSGAGELLHRSPESAEQLRRNVTSPNGTTQAALEVLMAPDGLQPLLTRAVAAGARRSRELAG